MPNLRNSSDLPLAESGIEHLLLRFQMRKEFPGHFRKQPLAFGRVVAAPDTAQQVVDFAVIVMQVLQDTFRKSEHCPKHRLPFVS